MKKLSNSRITVKDLARICGVSIGTVDRAINGRGGINPDTKKRILDAAEANGFVKNQTALSLSSGRSALIGVIITDLSNEFLTTILTAIESEASPRGFSTLIMMSKYDPERELECAARMRSMNIAGLIVFPVTLDPGYYLDMIRRGIPVVTIGNRADGIPFAGIDDFAAMKEGTGYVLSRGYRRLIYAAPLLQKTSQNIRAQLLRRDGFLAAVESFGSGAEADVEYHVVDSYDKYRRMLAELESGAGRDCSFDAGTALICPSDTYTADCLPLVRGRYGLMGFDRLPLIGRLIPELAGVAYPTAEIGKAAVGILLDRTDSILLPFKIVPGETI